MIDRDPPSCPEPMFLEPLHRQVEIGWRDLDAGRVSDFDAVDIKKCGRDRLTMKSEAQQSSATR